MAHATRSRHTFAPTVGRSIALLTVLAVTLYAAPGSLDPSFGTSGKVITNFGGTFPEESADFAAAAVGAFGFIVAAGSSSAAGTFDFAMARYAPNGALDPTFGTGGKVTTDFNVGGLSDDRAFAAALDGSLRTVLAGTSNGSFGLARYLLNGSLDAGFGTGGMVTTAFSSVAYAYAVAVQADGKIVAAGSNGSDYALARYNANGSLDNTFGTGGTVTTDIGRANESALIRAMAIQPDGKIVVAGNYAPEVAPGSFSSDLVVARYNTDGTLDPTFALGGVFSEDVSGTMEADGADAVTLLSNGKIVVGGFTRGPDGSVEMVLLRLTPGGALDVTFGASGQVITGFGPYTYAGILSLAVQTNGKILAGGYVDITGQDFAVARYNANGGLDQSFGSRGIVTTNISTNALAGRPTNDTVWGLVIQPTGKIVAVGTADNDFALTRYDK